MHLLRWHHRLGVVAALFLLLLAGTGVMLNHSSKLNLQENSIQSSWLLKWYGISEPEISSYAVGNDWLSHLGSNDLYFNGQRVASCVPPFHGGLLIQDILVAGCSNELLLFTRQGEIIERLGSLHGLPVPISGLGIAEDHLVVASNTDMGFYDMDKGVWLRLADGGALPLQQPAPQSIPTDLRDNLASQFTGSEINMERVLLDVHSGRFFGEYAVYVFDLMALFFCLLAMSGVWVWYTRPSHKFFRKRKKSNLGGY
jgi:hypothetical protein